MKNLARLMETASAHHRAGKLAEAEQNYNEILKLDEGNARALCLLGALYLQARQPARAVIMLEKALHAEPSSPEALNNLGAALQQQGRQPEAVLRYQEAIAARPAYPEALNNLGNLLLAMGRTEEAASTFTTLLQSQPQHLQARINLARALHAQDKKDEAISHYEEALQRMPSNLDILFHLCEILRETGRLEEALAHYRAALRREPGNFRLMNNVGNLLREAGRLDEAVVQYAKAVRLNPDYAEVRVNLGTVLRDLGHAGEAMENYEKALSIKPNDPSTLVNIGTLLQDLGRMDEAIARYDAALGIKPDLVDARWNKALALLAKGEYREGWKLYECGIGHKNKRESTFRWAKPWDGRPFPGKRLLIRGEQGLGDSLQFVRYAALCKERSGGGKIIAHCPGSLARILKTNPYVDDVMTLVQEKDFDYEISIMSLPYMFGTDIGTVPASVPYLSVTPDAEAKWAARFENKSGPKIGLVWAGSPREDNIILSLVDKRRSLHLSRLAPLLDLAPAQFYSLQLGKPAAQIAELGLGHKIADFTADIHDFMDTAVIIHHLDLVISVDTSVVHLAGALGKPVWVLSRFDACWRWLQNRERSPWYPTARIFGQPSPGDWDSAIAKLSAALKETFKAA